MLIHHSTVIRVQAIFKKCVILQGSPMADLLKWHHATVTTCHSKTKDLPDVVCMWNGKRTIKLEYNNTCIAVVQN